MQYNAPLQHMRYLLNDVFNAEKHWVEMPFFASIDAGTVDAILEEGAKLCSEVIAPLNRSGDEEGARIENGKVSTPKGFRDAYRLVAQGGWVGLGGDPAYGGQGLPKMLTVLFEEMLYSANNAFTLYVALTSGATLAIHAHANEQLKKMYLPKMYSGEWAGAMCLTEPHCGSDLGLLKTRAVPQENETYKISGTKIFITGGDHDLTDNIVHLVLARLPDAPAGPKGISLFLVPKFLPDTNGNAGTRNAVAASALEHKMGIKASATCVMNFDDATGWLVGKPHQGLAAMFTMMNYERLSIGLQGIGCGEMSYQNAARYAKDRLQGRAPHGVANPQGIADPIIHHADIRRMLLTQRAYNEAGRAFAVYVGLQLDLARHHPEKPVQDKATQRVALLTPVAKAFFTDKGFEACVLGQQVFGGHGYIREWGQEQLVRDARIAQIYEGTNGIQAQDLLKRKVLANDGKWMREFILEMEQDVMNQHPMFTTEEDAVLAACSTLRELTLWLVKQDKRDADLCGSAACDYLHVVGHTIYAWLWLKLVASKPTDTDQHIVGRFYLGRLLPQIHALDRAIRSGADLVMDLPNEKF
ncbi:MAG TPA: acyl-CoA dehydrogenase family protein [Pseudomonadales bacterium]|nr:acyl-CoA dehydrogenase family protein [Pseudomonadales bacterium]